MQDRIVTKRRAWIGLAVIALPCLLYSMDLTVLNLAMPRIVSALHPSSTQQLWIIDSYGFVLAASLLTMGALGDRIGRRRVLLIGAAAFGATSILAAFATSASLLIACRALMGVAGATLAPSTLALIRTLFPDERERVTAIGIWTASFSAGAGLGPLLGGVLLQHYDWGSVFLLGVPVMALLLLVGPRLLPEAREVDAAPIDLPSTALALAAVLFAIWGVKHVATGGGGGAGLAAMAVGVGLGLRFVQCQRGLARPLIELRLFHAPGFARALALNLLAVFVAFGVFVAVTHQLLVVFGLSPLVAGLWTLPQAAGFVVGSLGVPALAARHRPTSVIAAGLLLAATGLVLMASGHGLASLVPGTVLLSLGISPVPTLATALVMGAAPPERAGVASALSETASELGGALGIALLGSLGAAVGLHAFAAITLVAAALFVGGAVLAVSSDRSTRSGTIASVACRTAGT